MPKMISLRNHVVGTLSGHMIGFKRNEPVEVPLAAVQDCLNAGCAFVEDGQQEMHDDMSRAKFMLNGPVRRSVIMLAIKAIKADGGIDDFDAAGAPKVQVVSKLVGFDTNAKELRDIYQQYLQIISSGDEFDYVEGAETAFNIIRSTSKSDLLLIAEELGYDMEAAKGTDGRELRKAMLAKVLGVAKPE